MRLLIHLFLQFKEKKNNQEISLNQIIRLTLKLHYRENFYSNKCFIL